MGIMIFGSFAVDLTSRSHGLPRPGETLLGTSFKIGPGGKGSNQAVSAHRAGGDVTFVTKVGKDVFGQVALDFYAGENMNTEKLLFDAELPTGTAVIMVDEETAQNQIVFTAGACGHITPEDVEVRRADIEKADVFLGQLEINLDAMYKAVEIARNSGAHVIVNPAPATRIPDEVLVMVDTITPNETEAEVLTGVCVTDQDSARKAARVFFDKGVKNVIITLGKQGVYAADGEKEMLLPGIPVNAVDTTGAGDAFNGAFAVALSEGKDLFEALKFGNVAGALSVTRAGAAPSMAKRDEIEEMYKRVYG